jgi:nitrite reductase/ring-hydroxylating ferredoxin subunit
MAEWTRLIELDKVPVGQPVFAEACDTELAVFHLDEPDRVVVLDNFCPHAGGNLAGGEVGTAAPPGRPAADQVPVVVCPWHHWVFNIDTGICLHSEHAQVRVFDTQIKDGAIYVKI